MRKPHVVLFNIATNGFASKYAPCLKSHKAYSTRFGYALLPISRPIRVADPALAAWLKVSVMAAQLAAGFDFLAYIDADCRISSQAPDFTSLFESASRDVLMARGRSGRLNSGVILVRNTASAVTFFDQVLASVTSAITEQDRAGLKYENGNMVHVAARTEAVGELPPEWNNTYQPDLADHIRHYTGPLRDELPIPLRRRLAATAIRRTTGDPTPAPESRDRAFAAQLAELTDLALRRNTLRAPKG